MGYKKNIQAKIEKQHLYVLARCPSTDQQLLYTDERINVILQMKEKRLSENGIEITDIMKIFKRDHPASQFEAGTE